VEGAIPTPEIVTYSLPKRYNSAVAVREFGHLKSMGMGMNRELAQRVSIRSARRRNRWYGPGISLCLARTETGTAPRKPAVNWNRVLGLATALVVVVVVWTAVGIAVSYVLR